MNYYFKTLRKIKTGQFCKYLDGVIYVCEIPELLSEKAVIDDLKVYSKKYDNAVGIEWDKYEIIDVEINTTDVQKRKGTPRVKPMKKFSDY